MRYRFSLLISFTLVLALGAAAARPAGSATELPSRLTDQEFWQLSESMSEPNGMFQSDNLLSNEVVFARILPDLVAKAKPGGVYLGVGPEQNFTYMAATSPRMAFITDIRRGNLHVQLMYKALFELSADRAEFVSRLFTKPRGTRLTASSTVTEIMNWYWDAFSSDEAMFTANLKAIHEHLTQTHHLPLPAEDLDGIDKVYRAFYWYGPAITWSASISLRQPAVNSNGRGTYWDLVTQTDQSGEALSYLASEEKFHFLKDLEARNLVVPVVGNFSGPKALRAVGQYIRDRGATVTAFYLSNVESYLRRDGSWPTFCANVASMPIDEGSFFIRPSGGGTNVTMTPPNGSAQQLYQLLVTRTGQVVPANAVPLPIKPTTLLSGAFAAGVVPIAAETKDCNR
jgi:hypothetical protein